MQVWLNSMEIEQLYNELFAYFGLIDAVNRAKHYKQNRRIHTTAKK